MLGLPKGEVYLVPWSETWSEEFLFEKNRIQNTIGQFAINIHHIGSTAVKNLSAKPIIDIAIEIDQFDDGKHCITPLEQLGYSYRGTNILPERHYFNKGEPRTHQIHMYQAENKYLIEQLTFRNYLRKNQDVKVEYEQLKIQLTKANKHDKHKYADQKTNFIHSVLAGI